MRFTIIAIGKLKERFWVQACTEYLKRLQPYAKTTVVEVPDIDPDRAGGERSALDREGEGVLKALSAQCDRARVVLLAIGGRERSSEDLAAHLDALALGGTSDIAFVIGGSSGVSDAVKARADEQLSFGPITLPHNLARVVLLEQLYRACKILRGEPYHK